MSAGLSPPGAAGVSMVAHHPDEATLLDYAAGQLGRVSHLVVATHLEGCAACRDLVGTLHEVGAALLDALPPEPLSADALQRTLARLDAPPEPAPAEPSPELPPPLRRLGPVRYRWVAPGIRFAELLRTEEGQLGLLRVRPGGNVARHTHRGTEMICVLEGRYTDAAGSFGPGDFEMADASVHHDQLAEGAADCVCLLGLEGRLRFGTWLSRLWQFFMPF